ncbi:hypothetical protein HFM87_15830 [Blautia producta]|nr:hypothetical protein [Blautia producta]
MMEPTDEGNHVTNPPSEDEIYHLCKRQPTRLAVSPWGDHLPETVQLSCAAAQSQTR